MTTTAITPKRRFGVRRWIVLALIILGIYLHFGPLPPVSPPIFLPGEALPINLPLLNLPITNTLVATFIADLVILALGFYIWRRIRSGALVPTGLYNVLEAIFEFWWNLVVSNAGKKNARRFYPFIATIFTLVLINNWMGLIPGVDSVGLLEPAEGAVTGYTPRRLGGIGYWIDGNAEVPHAEDAGGHDELCVSCNVLSFVRPASTDLNFTLSLAFISVFMTQVFGFVVLKGAYLTKFLNFKALVTVPVWGAMDFAVGLLELISEIAKLISFTFRLFGNLFAGQLLLFILGSLVGFILPTGLLLFEMFVGVIQAYIFAMLTLVFMSQATTAHAESH